MAEHRERPAGDPRKDYDKTNEEVRERHNQGDIAPNQRTDGEPEIKGEGGARGKSGGSSQDGNQENTRRENNGEK